MTRRKDAVRNRKALLVAAAQVFNKLGAEAPLDFVAQQARLGRGTLYRHFPDRGALLAALVEERLDLLGELAAKHREDEVLLERLVVEICGFLESLTGLLSVASRFDSSRDQLADVTRRTGEILRKALRSGQQDGSLRPDITIQDVFVVISMIDGAILRRPHSVVPDSVDRAITLGLRALRTAATFDRPVPKRTLPFPFAVDGGSPERQGAAASDGGSTDPHGATPALPVP